MASWPTTVQFGSKGYEVALLQSCLNEISNLTLVVDGDFGNGTKAKVVAFQSSNGLTPDGIVGPNTWSNVFANVERYIIRFQTGNNIENDPATEENDALYESNVVMDRINTNGISSLGTFQGSIMPDDMDVKGRIKNGWYRLKLGFHKRNGIPTTEDLVVKNSNADLRPALIVNEDAAVPVQSNDPNKTTSDKIHIHNGFKTERGSDGCQTIRPSEWSAFISQFLDKYGSLEDWHKNGSYRGRDMGVLIIE
ncbi:MAG: peptidoglycan-binding protein [Planctomycetaceae bacterium]|nr:peptidoglycan-binding protein [Planctomycetaceae bacterium]